MKPSAQTKGGMMNQNNCRQCGFVIVPKDRYMSAQQQGFCCPGCEEVNAAIHEAVGGAALLTKLCPQCRRVPQPKKVDESLWSLECQQHGHIAYGDSLEKAVEHWNRYIDFVSEKAA